MKREINRSKKKGYIYIYIYKYKRTIYIYKYKMILPYKFCWKQVFVQIVIRFNLKERRISESQQSKLILSLCSLPYFPRAYKLQERKLQYYLNLSFIAFKTKLSREVRQIVITKSRKLFEDQSRIV